MQEGEQVGQVGDAQVEDEQVGGAARLAGLLRASTVITRLLPSTPSAKIRPEHHQRDEVLHADPEERPGFRGRGLEPARVQLAGIPSLQLHGAQGSG